MKRSRLVVATGPDEDAEMKIARDEFRGGYRYWFFCPGCKRAHAYTVGCEGLVNQNWSFDPVRVSFAPSLLNSCTDAQQTICHLFITDGKIAFCGDCAHDHSGKTVDLPDFPENYILPVAYRTVL